MSPLRIFVSGMISADPCYGGAAWAVLQYVIGLRELGHEVYLVEPIPQQSIAPASAPLAASVNARYFLEVASRFDLASSAALLCEATRETVGLTHARLRELAKGCDLLINISGMLTDPAILGSISHRVYLDLDPAFNQMWHAGGIDMRFDGHTHFVTVGRSIGRPGCRVPACHRDWIPALPPVVLSHWPCAQLPREDHGWTTVGNWRGYGSIQQGAVLYGQKAHSLRRFIELPRRTSERVQLAMSVDPGEVKDLAALRDNGWQLIDPRIAAATPETYQAFIQRSKGEIGVAKSGYVESQCGWFSDRSACYLASGRPVVAQDTGFSHHLPTGEGLLAFRSLEDALEGVERVAGDYARHARRAREIAEAHLRSDRVLNALLESVSGASFAGASEHQAPLR